MMLLICIHRKKLKDKKHRKPLFSIMFAGDDTMVFLDCFSLEDFFDIVFHDMIWIMTHRLRSMNERVHLFSTFQRVRVQVFSLRWVGYSLAKQS